jgi:dihydroorotase
MLKTVRIRTPDDFHVHLRDGAALQRTVTDSAQRFARVLAMPNLQPPICTIEQMLQYKQRVSQVSPAGFRTYFTLYLTEQTSTEQIALAAKHPDILAYKLYPAGATTNSNSGINDFNKCAHIFAELERQQMPLCIHGESTDPTVDVFEREKVFIDHTLTPLLNKFPNLKVVLEHISTAYAVNFIKSRAQNIAATITCHHLLYQRNHLLAQKLRPHFYCLPILKAESDRQALLQAATSGDKRFFLGTDSAPHTIHNKHNCGCAGIYTAHAAIELYCTAFDSVGKVDRLQAFASEFGAQFYNLPLNTSEICLENTVFSVQKSLGFADEQVQPLCAGENIPWKIRGQKCPA